MNASEPRSDAVGAESAAPQASPAQQSAPRPAAPPAVAPTLQQQQAWAAGRPLDSEPRRKSPPLACILSVVPGLGQVYVGYYGLGFVHAITVASLITLMASIGPRNEQLIPLLVIFFIFFMLYNIVDAGRRAALYNQALAGVPGVALPHELSMPGPGGSIFAGVSLIFGGLIVLMHTKFGFSLEWVEQWWPLAPIIFGGYLLFRAVQDRASSAQ